MHLSRSALIVAGGLAASLFVVPIGAGIGNAASATLGRHPVSAGSTQGGVGVQAMSSAGMAMCCETELIEGSTILHQRVSGPGAR
jgi:hypothetical protein